MHDLQTFWVQYTQEILLGSILLAVLVLLGLWRGLVIQQTRLHSLSVKVEEMATGLLTALNDHRQEIAD